MVRVPVDPPSFSLAPSLFLSLSLRIYPLVVSRTPVAAKRHRAQTVSVSVLCSELARLRATNRCIRASSSADRQTMDILISREWLLMVKAPASRGPRSTGIIGPFSRAKAPRGTGTAFCRVSLRLRSPNRSVNCTRCCSRPAKLRFRIYKFGRGNCDSVG